MAETVTVVAPVINMLAHVLIKKVNLSKGVHREVKSLKDELESIQCFLMEAEEKSGKGGLNEGMKTWVKQVRKEAYHVEDVIDEYVLYVVEHGHHVHGFRGLLRKTCHFIKTLKPRYDIAFEIRNIKASFLEIKARGERYGFSSMEHQAGGKTTSALCPDPRLGSLFVDDDEFFDIHLMRDELVTRLVGGTSTRMVISLVGVGGIGKTTLAKNVYEMEAVKGHFDCRAWVTVSQSYDIEKLLRILVKQICPTAESLSGEIDTIEELINPLRQHLQTKRYVIVLDDVWQMDFWGVVKHVLPANMKASRIIVTTRNCNVASSCQSSSFGLLKKLLPLSREMALELFCKKAFQFERERQCPRELEQLSSEILRKCEGLPLVIVTVAGLLSTKEKVVFEWQKLHDCLNFDFENNPCLRNISKILSLSYHDLPPHLKSCFLYFGIFPKDYIIDNKTLYSLWIAEGFVKEKRDKTLEEVAEEYLNELIHRNLVLSKELDGLGRLCQVHDLMHDIILSRVHELGFSQAVEENNLRCEGISRRLSIYGSTNLVVDSFQDSKARSVFLFNTDVLPKSFVVTLFASLKLLKVLSFKNVPLKFLPEEVGSLFHLRYLSLCNTKVKMLPKSIGKLHNLQMLDLRHTLVFELPIKIHKLRSLRHLLVDTYNHKLEFSFDSVHGLKIRGSVGCLQDLQTLRTVEASHCGIDFIRELEKLRNLRSLGISKLTTELGRALCAWIGKMKRLSFLVLFAINGNEVLDLQSISSSPRFLRVLVLKCRLQKLPGWIAELHNLRRLSLYFSRLTDDPLKCLHGLPNLEILWLNQAYDGEQLHFREGGFLKLKELELRRLDGLKVVKIEKMALPLLEVLMIGPSPLLEDAFFEIQHLNNLKSFHIFDMPREFVFGMHPNGGRNCWKIKHVQSVRVWHKKEGVYDCCELGNLDLQA